jgi:hypothetical protein
MQMTLLQRLYKQLETSGLRRIIHILTGSKSASSLSVKCTASSLSVKCTCFLVPTHCIISVVLACYSSKLRKSTDMYSTVAASTSSTAANGCSTGLQRLGAAHDRHLFATLLCRGSALS